MSPRRSSSHPRRSRADLHLPWRHHYHIIPSCVPLAERGSMVCAQFTSPGVPGLVRTPERTSEKIGSVPRPTEAAFSEQRNERTRPPVERAVCESALPSTSQERAFETKKVLEGRSGKRDRDMQELHPEPLHDGSLIGQGEVTVLHREIDDEPHPALLNEPELRFRRLP